MAIQLGRGGKQGVAPNINITPLVDVVLVLLIIFMVVIPNVQDGKPIEMVKVAKADAISEEADPLIVTIDAKGVFTLDEEDMPRPDAITKMRQHYASKPNRPVLLRADASLHYKTVRNFLQEVQELGFTKVGLSVGVGAQWDQDGPEGVS